MGKGFGLNKKQRIAKQQRRRRPDPEMRQEALLKLGFSTYSDYLASDLWKAIRARVLDRAGHLCRLCGKNRATQVHHTSYMLPVMRGDFRLLRLLVASCGDCHRAVEFAGERKRKPQEVALETRRRQRAVELSRGGSVAVAVKPATAPAPVAVAAKVPPPSAGAEAPQRPKKPRRPWPVSVEDAERVARLQSERRARTSPAEEWLAAKLSATEANWTRHAAWGFRLFSFWSSVLGVAVELNDPGRDAVKDAEVDVADFKISAIITLRVDAFDDAGAAEIPARLRSTESWFERRVAMGLYKGKKGCPP